MKIPLTKVRRRDGRLVEFDSRNVSAGVAKAGASVEEAVQVAKEVSKQVAQKAEVTAEELSEMVATALRRVNRKAADEFVRYRNEKRKSNK